MSETSKFPWWTVAAGTVAVAGNGFAALVMILSLLRIAPGSGVRLMAEAIFVFYISVATFLVALPLAIISLWRERHRLIGVFAVCLALTPFFFSGWVMRHFAEMRGIFLEP